jgi:hypothetical protein
MDKVKGRITQVKIARAAGIEPGYFNHILHKRCPCPPRLAPKLEKITNIPRATWVWGSKKELLAAWENFVSFFKEAA